MKKNLLILVILSLFCLIGDVWANDFTKALRTCSQYSQLGSNSYQGTSFNILITLEKSKNKCTYKEKISKGSDYQLLTCHFPMEDLSYIADNMDKFTEAYKKEIEKNRIHEAKLTNNYDIFDKFLINPKYCLITASGVNSSKKVQTKTKSKSK